MTLDAVFKLLTFSAVFCALLAAHQVGDHWVQTHNQACMKGDRTKAGQVACFTHVVWLIATKAVALRLLMTVTGLTLDPWWLAAGLTVDAFSHYWADRRYTLARFAELIGKGDFYRLGAGHLGSGAYALDQSWHVGWLFITSLIISAGA
ncbi:DUF3307 domain-containing protein [Nonomuraea rhizosphaerae]|uniref:DUF3307 domain-containing protein n=1 Tax=Nonomuraea rhizosphaerae TaxID=2665663 RepID=UPI0027E2A7E4|nr:DUF3307 domain-containing protein [Nonomuraea rhizosphaerae]